MGTGNTHLINNCGEVVNSWTSDFASGGACYLLEDGSLVRGCRIQGAFSGGAWEANWNVDPGMATSLDPQLADNEKHHHHDFAWMPNGHVLVLAWELKTANDAALAGRTNPQTMWPESITEIAPTLPEGGTVLWEWHAWDHLYPRHGRSLGQPRRDPSDHPHRIDVNHANVGGGGGPGGASSGDWMHANAVNYNPQLDQIAISSRRFNEVWIIDHGITSESGRAR